jgi:hypothetical protein
MKGRGGRSGIIATACALGYKGDELGELYRQSASEAFQSDTYTGMIMHGPGAKAARSLEAVLRRRCRPHAPRLLRCGVLDWARVSEPG